MKKTLFWAIFVGVLIGVGFGIITTRPKDTKVANGPTPTSTPQDLNVGIPKRIIIPRLSVDSLIESVQTDKDGNMDIPKNFNNTAWYSPGPKPGESGSAVIDGHVDTPTGAPAVFAKIAKLSQGDAIEVVDEKGKKYNFHVIKVVDYELGIIPLTQIFSKDTPPMLNLITCAGVFDKSKKMYDKRTVVYSMLAN